jgi:hypothetical protein
MSAVQTIFWLRITRPRVSWACPLSVTISSSAFDRTCRLIRADFWFGSGDRQPGQVLAPIEYECSADRHT